MRYIASLVAVLVLAGCAAKVLSSGPRTVVIQSREGVSEAQPMAEAECAKHGRHAQLVGHERALVNLVFDCVL